MMKMGKTVEDRLVKLMMVKMAMNLTDDAEECVEIHHGKLKLAFERKTDIATKFTFTLFFSKPFLTNFRLCCLGASLLQSCNQKATNHHDSKPLPSQPGASSCWARSQEDRQREEVAPLGMVKLMAGLHVGLLFFMVVVVSKQKSGPLRSLRKRVV